MTKAKIIITKGLLIFFLAFVLNYAWEHAHAVLYTNYKGGAISEFVLIRATTFDALYTMIVGTAFLTITILRKRKWLMVLMGFVVAVNIEWYALATERWGYTTAMPIIPIINVGLTPAIQLGLLSYILLIYIDRKTKYEKTSL